MRLQANLPKYLLDITAEEFEPFDILNPQRVGEAGDDAAVGDPLVVLRLLQAEFGDDAEIWQRP